MKTKTDIVAQRLPYLDANALVYAFLRSDSRSEALLALMGKGAVVSSLAIDELLWVAHREQYTHTSQLIYELLRHPTIEFIEVRCLTQLYAAELMRKHKLKPRDALHAALMHEEGITTIISYDADFDRVPGIKRMEP